MKDILIYIIQVNILLSIIYFGYYLLLRGLTFYRLNRVYLLLATLYALLYPLIDVQSWFSRQTDIEMPVVWSYLPEELMTESVTPSVYTLNNLLLAICCIGAGLLLLRFLTQLISLVRIHYHSRLSQWGQYLYRNVFYPIVPFSFFNKIYLHKAQHSEPELYDIFEHENIHVKGLHSVDILVFEMLWIACWYNPFVWLMRKAVRQNLEYLTDQQVLNRGVDRQTYQYSLLHVTKQGASVDIGNRFNFKTLKKRIMMMNKKRSSKLELSKYAFLLPVLILAGASFTVSKAESEIEKTVALAKDVDIAQLLTKEATKPDSTKQENRQERDYGGFLLDGELVGQEVIERLNAKDIESWVWHMDNSMTKHYGLEFLSEVKTKKYTGTLGTPSRFKSVTFREDGQITVEGPTSGFARRDPDERVVSVIRDTINGKNRSMPERSLLLNRSEIDQSKEYPLLAPDFNKDEVSKRNMHYVIDGKRVTLDEFLTFPRAEIHGVDIYKEADDIFQKIGVKNSEGLFVTTSKGAVNRKTENTETLLQGKVTGISLNTEPVEVETSKRSVSDLIIRGTQADTKLGSIIFVDGKQVSGAELRSLDMHPNNIENITVRKATSPSTWYSEIGKHSAIAVKNKEQVPQLFDTIMVARKPSTGNLSIRGMSNQKPLIVVDGKTMSSDFEMKSLGIEQIESITVMKDDSAVAVYGKKGKDGVVIVTLKSTKPENIRIYRDTLHTKVRYSHTVRPTLEVHMEGLQERIDSTTSDISQRLKEYNASPTTYRVWSQPTLSNPAYIIDGKLIGANEYAQIDRSKIKGISTMTKAQADAFYKHKYDLKNHDGVVTITMK